MLALERTYDGDYLGRRALSDEAVEIALRLGDPATAFDVLLRRWQAIWVPDTVEELLGEITAGAARGRPDRGPGNQVLAGHCRKYVFDTSR